MRSFFRFLRNILLVALLACGIYAYQHDPNVRTATNDSITVLGQRVNQLLTTGHIQLPKMGDKNTQKSSVPIPKKALTKETGKKQIHWSKPEAKVYVNLASNPTLRSASIDALNNWNRTGAFTFKQVDHRKQAQIVIQDYDDSGSSAAGETFTTYNPADHLLLKATVYLNKFYLQNPWYGYDNNRIVNTVEHELGHAIGLNHTNGVSVMYPKGSVYTIQPQDIQAVKRIYQEK